MTRFSSAPRLRGGCAVAFLPLRYIWGSDYIEDTWFRDVAYMVVGLSALLATGTFFNLAGMISPMAVLKQVRSTINE